jgi:UDP-glucose 4-epimerase
MKLLITGAHGKVGRATIAAALREGHKVTGVDLGRPSFDRPDPGAGRYQQADLADAGSAFALLARTSFDAVIHAAAIPEPTGNPPHVVFHNNLMGTFNLLEAAVRFGVPRFVNVSSETVPGFFFPERPWEPEYLPIDEEHPVRPQDPYALAKAFGEQLCDAAVARSDIKAITIRPSWVQNDDNYAWNLGPQLRDPDTPSAGYWAYIDVEDLADAPSNLTLPELLERQGIDIPLRELDRPDAGGISIAKARRLLGYDPKRSWRDHLDPSGAPQSA